MWLNPRQCNDDADFPPYWSGLAVKGLKPLREHVFKEGEPVKLSICTVTYNHAPYLRQCLEGFLDQICYDRVEIIVHDDASNDGTADILRDYVERYPSIIRPIIQEVNLFSKGVNPYYSFLFPASKGDFIALCDGDDYWDDPAKISTQLAFLETHADVAVTYGSTNAVRDGQIDAAYRSGLERNLSSDELKRGLPINSLTACFRNIFQDGPPVFLCNAPVGDMTVWAALGHHGRGVFLPELKPAYYRQHDGGIFSKKSLETQLFMGTMSLLAMAAYHHAKSDRRASAACMKRALGQIVMLNGASATCMETLRKSISLLIKTLRLKVERSTWKGNKQRD